MVPVAPAVSMASPLAMRRVAREAVDLNLKRAGRNGDDPFGSAVLLWSCVQHREQLVNLDGLIAWARDYTRRVLVDGQAGRKRDEATSAALLAAAALEHAAVLPLAEMSALRAGASAILAQEIQP